MSSMNIVEIRDITLSAAGLAIAFAIAFSGGIQNMQNFSAMLVIMAFVAVSVSFILHEIAHRFLARRYGFYAEYKMWPYGLALALLLSLFGFVFAAPGAVMIHPKSDLWGASAMPTRKKMGLIALAGPLTNVALAGIFAVALLINPLQVFALGVFINLWLAFFNMIPIFVLDGEKVMNWNKKIWALVFLPLLLVNFAIIFGVLNFGL